MVSVLISPAFAADLLGDAGQITNRGSSHVITTLDSSFYVGVLSDITVYFIEVLNSCSYKSTGEVCWINTAIIKHTWSLTILNRLWE